jgi:short-subunit dehydrogenase
MWFYFFQLLTEYVIPTLGWIFFVGLILHVLPILLVSFLLGEQNLKTKYKASWAFISGGSQGLGFAIAEKLAKQGLNLVICALDDETLTKACENLQQRFPNIIIRRVGCNLGDRNGSYLSIVKEATKDISVQVVFSNAGYIVISLFPKTNLERLTANWTCNITSHIEITHYFFEKMVQEKKKGCIVYTSSNAGFWPSPTSTLYGASKAAMTQMASSLAIEGVEYGIDVTAIVAGPMQTSFVNNVQGAKLDALKTFMKIASTPESVASVLLRSVGRVAIRDHSILTIFLRNVFKILDVNLVVRIIAFFQPYTSDWKKLEH